MNFEVILKGNDGRAIHYAIVSGPDDRYAVAEAKRDAKDNGIDPRTVKSSHVTRIPS